MSGLLARRGKNLVIPRRPRVFDFKKAAGVGQPGLAQTRNDTDAYFFDESVVLQQAGANDSRFTHTLDGVPLGYLSEMASTNEIRNNTMVGAVAATDTPPDNWFIDASLAGILDITEVGTEDGMEFFELHFSGTPSGGDIEMEESTQIAALVDEIWTNSIYLKLISGDFTNVDSILLKLEERDSGGSVLGIHNADLTSSISSSKTRFSLSPTLVQATTAFVRPALRLNHVSGAWEFTLRIYIPQCEEQPFATSPIKTSSAAVTRDKDTLTGTYLVGNEGTIKIVATAPDGVAGAGTVPFRIDDGTGSTNKLIIFRITSRVCRFQAEGSNAGNVNADSVGTWADAATVTISFSWSTSRGIIQLSLDRETAVETAWTDLISAPMSRIFIGQDSNDGSQPGGTIERVDIYPYALFGAALQSI